jgi:hypothetical protein
MCRDNARPAGRGDVLRSGGAAILRRSGSACAKPPERDGSSPMQEFGREMVKRPLRTEIT